MQPLTGNFIYDSLSEEAKSTARGAFMFVTDAWRRSAWPVTQSADSVGFRIGVRGLRIETGFVYTPKHTAEKLLTRFEEGTKLHNTAIRFLAEYALCASYPAGAEREDLYVNMVREFQKDILEIFVAEIQQLWELGRQRGEIEKDIRRGCYVFQSTGEIVMPLNYNNQYLASYKH